MATTAQILTEHYKGQILTEKLKEQLKQQYPEFTSWRVQKPGESQTRVKKFVYGLITVYCDEGLRIDRFVAG